MILDLVDVSKTFRPPYSRSQSLRDRFFGRALPQPQASSLRPALRGVNLQLQAGDRLALLGRNGAGKTTLMRIIAGLLRPTTGEVRYRGTIAPILQLGTGFHPELSGRKNLYLGASLFGLSRAQMSEMLPAIVGFAELEAELDRPIKTYSLGMRTRLGFALCTALQADLYLLDEGLSAGDPAFQVKARRRIWALLEQGKTWVISSHDLQELQSLCNLALLLHQGEVLAFGPFAEVLPQYLQLLQG